MKRFLTMLLVLLMLLSRLPCLAEGTFREAFGFALDLSAIQDRTANYLELHRSPVSSEAPYLALASICYYALPREKAEALSSALNATEDKETFEELSMSLSGRGCRIATIVVTDANSLEEAGIADFHPGSDAVTEFGAQGSYHYYCIVDPIDQRVPLLDDGEALEEADVADIQAIQSELLEQLRAAELSEPARPGTALTDQVIDLESAALDEPAGDTADAVAGAVENDEGAYRVIVLDRGGNPVEGALIQFCDDATCAFQPTDANGIATFAVGEQKAYEVHVLQAPEGYVATGDIYHTLETWSDVSIVLEKADQAESAHEATESGVAFSVPESLTGIEGSVEQGGFGDD